jgi:hypothetical protein
MCGIIDGEIPDLLTTVKSGNEFPDDKSEVDNTTACSNSAMMKKQPNQMHVNVAAALVI